jgi:hypothetical protein
LLEAATYSSLPFEYGTDAVQRLMAEGLAMESVHDQL